MAVKHVVVRAPGTPRPGKKYFTVEEARTALVYVSRIVEDVTTTYRRIVRLRRELENTPGLIGAAEMERDYDRAMDRLSGYIDELHDVGVELKDFEQGLIDFPSVFEGREILLCWRRGEESIDHWHEVDAGFAGRRSVTMLHPDRTAAAA